MPTIRDVAKLAGVAPITVSRAINDSGCVSQETRAKIEAAVEELGYIPNMLAPSLRFQKTMTLAAVVTDITNPFWTTVTRGVEDVAQDNGYAVILCNTDESEEKQAQYLQMLLSRRIDGILLVPVTNSPDPIRLIQKQSIPVVLMGRRTQGVDVDVVRADSEEGTYQLTQHLLALGHRQITLLTGPKDVSAAQDRADGFCRALRKARLDICDTQIMWGEFTKESGYAMAREALERNPKPTALFAANNFIAIGALRALKEQNYRVPEDIAIVAVDDIPPEFTLQPFLSVATQPALRIGQQACQILLERIKGDSIRPYQQVVFPTEVIIRDSSGDEISA